MMIVAIREVRPFVMVGPGRAKRSFGKSPIGSNVPMIIGSRVKGTDGLLG